MKPFRCSDARRRQSPSPAIIDGLDPPKLHPRVVEIVSSEVNTADRKRLSFAFDFVASDFFSPAWRNWQTRWTQNPVIARSCGFEPLRRQSLLRLSFSRRLWKLGAECWVFDV